MNHENEEKKPMYTCMAIHFIFIVFRKSYYTSTCHLFQHVIGSHDRLKVEYGREQKNHCTKLHHVHTYSHFAPKKAKEIELVFLRNYTMLINFCIIFHHDAPL